MNNIPPTTQSEGGISFREPPNNQKETPSRSRVFKFSIIAIGALVALFALAVVYEAFFSPRAVGERETQKNYEIAKKGLNDFRDKMTADTYGGKTPQETLDLFIIALEEGDIELASKYFSLTGDSSVKLIEEEINSKTSEEIEEMVRILKEIKKNQRKESDDLVLFFKKNNKGEIEYSVLMSFNRFSQVWKIESM